MRALLYYKVWALMLHSVSQDCWPPRAIPTRVLKPEFKSVKDLRCLTFSVLPFLSKRVNSLGVIDFASFRFSKIALKPSTKLGGFFINVSGKAHLFQELPLSQ